MSAKKKEVSETAEKTVNEVLEEAVQPELSAAEPEANEATICTVQMCRVAFCGSLNLRRAPGMNAPVLQVIPAGTEIQIDPLEWVADGTSVWYPANVDGVTGFVSGQYLAPAGS